MTWKFEAAPVFTPPRTMSAVCDWKLPKKLTPSSLSFVRRPPQSPVIPGWLGKVRGRLEASFFAAAVGGEGLGTEALAVVEPPAGADVEALCASAWLASPKITCSPPHRRCDARCCSPHTVSLDSPLLGRSRATFFEQSSLVRRRSRGGVVVFGSIVSSCVSRLPRRLRNFCWRVLLQPYVGSNSTEAATVSD